MKTDYVVTAVAGDTVAHLPNPGAGKTVSLTEHQAEHPLRLGYIEAPKPKSPLPDHEPRRPTKRR